MKCNAKDLGIVAGALVSAMSVVGVQGLPSNALTQNESSKLYNMCATDSSRACGKIQVLVNGRNEDKATGAYQANLEGGVWWLFPSNVTPVRLLNVSMYRRDDTALPTPWSVLYRVVARTERGTQMVRFYAGNCLKRETRSRNATLAYNSATLFYLGTQEVQGQSVLREKKPNRLEMTSVDGREYLTLSTACYIAYDVQYVRDLIRRGTVSDFFERDPELPDPERPNRTYNFRSFEPEPYRFPDGRPY
ncbi:hypothetical protein [Leptolyngbya sp. GGD]|uniref:hypothetical protein n=1 Tax=Leptolyngbya sp. GGD TaxID=2997907 RepID=UPI00227C2B0B|nr:hypothetical protein [Leptolyngbya sp. GGD]MCY6494539.1 hypothetical protein [Leptolyngbya sp. GGD]